MQEYQIQKSIGIGSFGQVFQARQKKTNKIYVIKKIKIRDISQKEKQTIENEVKLLESLKHINIVSYKASFIDTQGFLNIVMQNCEGGDVYQKIRNNQGKKFDQNQIIDWVIQMSLAIYYMHQKRILHRDLKTQNIFLTNGKVKLGDFGISKVLDSTKQLTSTVIGTPYYMSPEVFKYRPYSYKTDIWALGCVMYQMCNLRHAFDAQNLNALAVKVLKGSFASINTQYSKPLRDLISKTLSVNPKQRPTIVELLKSTFLRRRLVGYIQQCIKENINNQQNQIGSLLQQAQKLGISIHNQIPRQPVIQKSYQSTPTPSNKNFKESVEKKFLEGQQKKKQLKQQLRKQMKQKQRIQEELKKSEEKKILDKRNQLLEREKERKKRLEQAKKISISEKKLIKEENILKLNETDHKKSPSPSINYHQKIQQQQSKKNIKHEIIVPNNVFKKKEFQGESRGKKSFKMQEEHDMNYEQASFENIPEQGQEEQKQEEIIKQVKAPIIEKDQKIIEKIKEQLKQKTLKINLLKTQLQNIDFQVSESSDEEKQNKETKQKKNPKYLKIQQKIASTRNRVESVIGKNQYQSIYNLSKNSGNIDIELLKSKILNIIEHKFIGYWHLIDQVIEYQGVLKNTPEFVL